jgi:hypothetical protein
VSGFRPPALERREPLLEHGDTPRERLTLGAAGPRRTASRRRSTPSRAVARPRRSRAPHRLRGPFTAGVGTRRAPSRSSFRRSAASSPGPLKTSACTSRPSPAIRCLSRRASVMTERMSTNGPRLLVGILTPST